MKPRLTLRYGIWACFTWAPRAMGCGYTREEAFSEWQSLFSAAEAQPA